jgi:hypothetical protein
MVLVAVTACRRSSGREPQIFVHSQITPQPVRIGPATITIQMVDAAGKPVARSTIEVESDMSHPGMAPVFGAAEETAPGSYRAHLAFNMGGDWVVLLHIKLPNGGTIERQVDVRGVQSN